MSKNNLFTLFLIVLCSSQFVACEGAKVAKNAAENTSLAIPWWQSVQPLVIDGDEFYGKPCSVTRVSEIAGTKTGKVIFEVPSRLLTYCAESEPDKIYLEYDGEYITLLVDRQTAGAGSWTGERYRSADFTSWQEYIGVTWVDGEEYEAWRTLGSSSTKADSRKKVIRE